MSVSAELSTPALCHCGSVATRDGEELGPICDECGPTPIPCGECGKPTTFDDTYGDLCFRCAFAENH